MSKTDHPKPSTVRPDDAELERLRAFLRDVRTCLHADPRSPYTGGSPEAILLSLKHALVRFDGAAPPAEPRSPDPSLFT